MKNNFVVLPGRQRPNCNACFPSRRRKARFLEAVRRLAPTDPLLHQVAERVPADRVHVVPQISAVNFVVAFYHLAPAPKAIRLELLPPPPVDPAQPA